MSSSDGNVVVKVDGKFVDRMEAIARGEVPPEVPQGDGLKTPRAVGAAEAEGAPKPLGEPGVKRTKKFLTCVLTPAEIAAIHSEIVGLVGEATAAERRVESIKERAKADVQFATNTAKELRERLDDKARTSREGKVDREVPVTVRIDWNARTKTTTRDDTGEQVGEVEVASQMEVFDCGTWVKDLKAGKSYLKAPDGAVLDERKLTDTERQADLPLPDGGAAPEAPAKAERAWVALGTWEDLDADTAERFIKPDPHGKAPAINWTEQGKYMVAAIPAGLRPQLDHHATQAGVPVFYGDAEPTLADLSAQSKEPPSKPRKGAAKKRPA